VRGLVSWRSNLDEDLDPEMVSNPRDGGISIFALGAARDSRIDSGCQGVEMFSDPMQRVMQKHEIRNSPLIVNGGRPPFLYPTNRVRGLPSSRLEG
jgi:hypothetical protein